MAIRSIDILNVMVFQRQWRKNNDTLTRKARLPAGHVLRGVQRG